MCTASFSFLSLSAALFPPLLSLPSSVESGERGSVFVHPPPLVPPPVGGSSRRWKVLSLAAWKEREGEKAVSASESRSRRRSLFISLFFFGRGCSDRLSGQHPTKLHLDRKDKKGFFCFWVRKRSTNATECVVGRM